MQLKLKPKTPAAAAPAAASAGAAPAAAPAFAASGSSGGIKLVLKDAKISIDKVVLAK
jgi:acetyl-CoA decarbonylase/synthase complex subunit beta